MVGDGKGASSMGGQRMDGFGRPGCQVFRPPLCASPASDGTPGRRADRSGPLTWGHRSRPRRRARPPGWRQPCAVSAIGGRPARPAARRGPPSNRRCGAAHPERAGDLQRRHVLLVAEPGRRFLWHVADPLSARLGSRPGRSTTRVTALTARPRAPAAELIRTIRQRRRCARDWNPWRRATASGAVNRASARAFVPIGR